MKNLLGLMVLSLFASSCVELTGQLDVKQPFVVTKKSGFLNLGRKKTTIEPKLYNASIKILGSKDFNLKLQSDTKIIIPISSTEELKFPDNGEIKISHKLINQSFDIQGMIDTSYNSTESQEAIEDCSVTLTENKCEKVCEPAQKDAPLKCAVVCKDVPSSEPGDKLVRYHYTTKIIKTNLELLDATKGLDIASFSGQDSNTYKVNEFEGRCFLKDIGRMSWEEKREWEERNRNRR